MIPAGASTSSIPRPKIGDVAYGGIDTAGVQDCIVPGKIAITFDDGPYMYTKDLLDLLLKYDTKVTFFISKSTSRLLGHVLTNHSWE
jgi:peptidoglycan/xylan/chitin deacetylase (PgdA/CDA1 family)